MPRPEDAKLECLVSRPSFQFEHVIDRPRIGARRGFWQSHDKEPCGPAVRILLSGYFNAARLLSRDPLIGEPPFEQSNRVLIRYDG
ncbi:MAG: hypothetical protein ACYDH6_07275 [Acidimicrobiales bacterium]